MLERVHRTLCAATLRKLSVDTRQELDDDDLGNTQEWQDTLLAMEDQMYARLYNNTVVWNTILWEVGHGIYIDRSSPDMRIPRQSGHPFRANPATHSDGKRPPIPRDSGHPPGRDESDTTFVSSY